MSRCIPRRCSQWRPFSARDVLAATPPLLILAGYGLSYVGERLRILERLPYRMSSPALVYAALTLVVSIWIAQGHARREPVDWKGTALAIQQMAGPGTAVWLPMVHPLLQYHAPGLAGFRVDDMAPGAGAPGGGNVLRSIVACRDGVIPDPCAGFREAAEQDSAWVKQGFRGFTVYVRE